MIDFMRKEVKRTFKIIIKNPNIELIEKYFLKKFHSI